MLRVILKDLKLTGDISSNMDITINDFAIEMLVKEWQNQKFPWIVLDTPLFQADAFTDSIQYLFLGCAIHYRFYGIYDDGRSGCYFSQNTEGSFAYWRTLKAFWPTSYDYKLKYETFARIFHGLAYLPGRYHDWMETLRILKQQYAGQVKVFLESCQWDVARILERIESDFPAFKTDHNSYSQRSHLFLYLAQGKFAGTNLFNKVDLILPYLDQILLASLIQTNVLELPPHRIQLSSSDITMLNNAAQKALEDILIAWNQSSQRKILPGDLNTALRNQGIVSIWRGRVPLTFA